MGAIIDAWFVLVVAVAGWINREQNKALEYLTSYTQSKMNEILMIYNNLHDKLIVKYSNSR